MRRRTRAMKRTDSIRAKTTVPAPPEASTSRPSQHTKCTLLPASGVVQAGTRANADGVIIPARAPLSRDAFALSIDHRTAFILLHVDGVSSVDDIAFMSGMPREVVLGILDELRLRGLVVFRAASQRLPA